MELMSIIKIGINYYKKKIKNNLKITNKNIRLFTEL